MLLKEHASRATMGGRVSKHRAWGREVKIRFTYPSGVPLPVNASPWIYVSCFVLWSRKMGVAFQHVLPLLRSSPAHAQNASCLPCSPPTPPLLPLNCPSASLPAPVWHSAATAACAGPLALAALMCTAMVFLLQRCCGTYDGRLGVLPP